MTKKSNPSVKQFELFSNEKKTEVFVEQKVDAKKPFIPVPIMALDSKDIKQNFMYMLRILMNSQLRNLSSSQSQASFIETLTHELKIKRGQSDPEISVRSCALKSLKK